MSSGRADLRMYLKFLYEVYTSFGFSSFIYNSKTKRLESDKRRLLLTWLIFGYGIIHMTLLLCWILYLTLPKFLLNGKTDKFYKNMTAVHAQEDFIDLSSYLSKFIRILLLAVNHLAYGGVITPVANEMLKIYNMLQQETDPTLRITNSFENILNIKLLAFGGFLLVTLPFYWLSLVFLNFFAVFGDVFVAVALFGHIYSQLVLAIAYVKMRKALEVDSISVDQRQLRKFLRLSFRINRVKGVLDKYFFILFLTTYLNLFDDIANWYVDITKWKLHKEFEDYLPWNWQFKYLVGVSFDFYLIGYVADMLIQSEILFAKQVLILFSRCTFLERSQIQRDVDQLMIRTSIFDLHTRACRTIKVDREFAFSFIMNIVLAYVVTCLQFYISGTLNVTDKPGNGTQTDL